MGVCEWIKVVCEECGEEFDYDMDRIPIKEWGYSDRHDFIKRHTFICGECS